MKRVRVGMILSLACAAALLPTVVNGQGRGRTATGLQERTNPDPDVARTSKLVELDAWLRRLTGRFRITEMNGIAREWGLWDCVAIGAGPGVDCVTGPGPKQRSDMVPPSIILFGVDPDNPGIRFLRVNNLSTAEEGLGKLEKDSVSFQGTCPNPPHLSGREGPPLIFMYCKLAARIFAPSGSRNVLIENTRVQTYRIGTSIRIARSVTYFRLERMAPAAQ